MLKWYEENGERLGFDDDASSTEWPRTRTAGIGNMCPIWTASTATIRLKKLWPTPKRIAKRMTSRSIEKTSSSSTSKTSRMPTGTKSPTSGWKSPKG